MEGFRVSLRQPQDFQSIADRRKGVAKFVRQHCQELVLAAVGLSQGFLGLLTVRDVSCEASGMHELAVLEEGIRVKENVTN